MDVLLLKTRLRLEDCNQQQYNRIVPISGSTTELSHLLYDDPIACYLSSEGQSVVIIVTNVETTVVFRTKILLCAETATQDWKRFERVPFFTLALRGIETLPCWTTNLVHVIDR